VHGPAVVPPKALALAVERQVVYVFGYQDMRQQAGPGNALGDGPGRQGADEYLSALICLRLGILGTDNYFSDQACGGILYPFGTLFADFGQPRCVFFRL
jgi:hypothetical protein